MSAVLAPLPVTPPPKQFAWPRPVPELLGQRFTPEEMYELDHPQRFGRRRRLFLLHGEIWEQGMPNISHDGMIEVAGDVLRDVFPRGSFRVRVQLSLRLADDTEVLPDLLVVRGTARDGLIAHPTTGELVVEVSDTTLFFDLTTKAELYAAAGVPEYWVIDVNAQELHVLRDPAAIPAGGHHYRDQQKFGPADTVTPLAAPNRPIPVADLLP